MSRNDNNAIIGAYMGSTTDMLQKKENALRAFFAGLMFVSLVSCSARAASLEGTSRLVKLLPIVLDPNDPDRKEFGALKLLSAFELSSRDKRFGGLSGLTANSDGKLYAVSDRGYWFSSRMILDTDGRLIDLVDGEIHPLLTPKKTPVAGKFYDAEALARAPDGSFVVAFEQEHRLWRYPSPPATFQSAPLPIPIPHEVRRAPSNGGLEGITFLPDGRLLALTEEFQNPDGSFKGWLIDNGRFAALSYLPSDGFRVTDCAALKNGDVIVLERRYVPLGNWSARLKLVSYKNIRPGAKIAGEEILRLDGPLRVDNFEGVAVQEDSAGTTIYLVSDDNYSPFQSTLLLHFRLPKAAN